VLAYLPGESVKVSEIEQFLNVQGARGTIIGLIEPIDAFVERGEPRKGLLMVVFLELAA